MRRDVSQLVGFVKTLIRDVRGQRMTYKMPEKFTELVSENVSKTLSESLDSVTGTMTEKLSKSVSKDVQKLTAEYKALNAELCEANGHFKVYESNRKYMWRSAGELAITWLPMVVAVIILLGLAQAVLTLVGLPWYFQMLREWFVATPGWWKLLPGFIIAASLGGFGYGVYTLGKWIRRNY